jgi:hypothetical protein
MVRFKGSDIMKRVAGLIWSFVAVVSIAGLQPTVAHAGGTCKVVPSWCPPAPDGGGGASTVPEPATLTVLALGAAAARIASRRRPRK